MIERLCSAKINLALAVGPPIPPGTADAGMHPICSWMARIDLADTLRIARSGGGSSTFIRRFADGRPADWPEADDLAVRAHRAIEAHLGRNLPIELELVKSIPPGGGLGGGSADAAGVLLGLRELFGLDLADDTLRAVGATLGSDIPFFVRDNPAPAIVSGLGERVEHARPVNAGVLLVIPPFGCSTGAVYQTFDRLAGGRDFDAAWGSIRDAAARLDFSKLFNDLLPAAEAVRPALRDLRERVARATGEAVHLSGSGSTLFLVNPGIEAAAVARIAAGCRVIAARTL